MSSIDKLHPQNHALYRRVQHLVSLRWKWEAIALDVGVYSVKDLVQWVLDYKEPKPLPMVRAPQSRAPVETITSPRRQTEQFIAWRRAKAGAAKALEAAIL